MAITTQMRTDVTNLYVSLFGRAPERDGLGFWVNKLDAGMTIAQVAQEMYNTEPARATYPTFLTNEEIVGKFYSNVLGRTADAEGLAFWTAKLNAGASKGALIAEMISAVQSFSGTGTDAITVAALASKALLANKVAVGLYYAVDLGGNDVAKAAAVLTNVTSDPASVDTAKNVAAGAVGQTFTLTTTAESLTGAAGNDTFNGSNTTLVLDVLDGASGTDVLNYSDAAGGTNVNSLGLTLTSVETINVRSTGAATATTTGFTGVNDVNVLSGTSATVVAATTTNVAASGVAGAITIDGGKDITVTDSTAANAITIGATTVNAGNVTVTDTNVGNAAIGVDGGKNVSLTLTGSASNNITVGNGGAATDLPTGTVNVASANKAVAGTNETLSAITVKGGTTITVTQTATSTVAATDTTGATVTQGAVTITGGTATTTVTTSQAKSTAAVAAVTAVAGVTETASVKFGALKAGDTLTLDADAGSDVDATELTFTAAVDMTAAEVAAAFASLVNGKVPTTGDTQGGGAASKGTYAGAATLWTSAAASSDTVVFTSTTANSNATNLAFVLTNTSGTSVAPVVTTTAGSAATVAKTGVLGVVNGTVVIDDNATAASITTVSVDGYGNSSTIGATNALTKLANLTLANSGSTGTAGETDAAMAVTATGVTSLNLTVNAIKGNVTLDGGGASVKTLNLTNTGADSTFALTAAAVETLAVSGDKSASLTADLAALKTVTVSGSAGLTLSGNEANTLESINTSATTGKVTATIDGAKATYVGGAGADVVTLATSTALTKAINLGAGDDTLSFGTLAVTGSSAALAGGDGTDTLSMTFAAADGLDGSVQSFYTGFERLTISDTYTGGTADTQETLTLNLANLGFTNYVTTSGTLIDASNRAAESDILVLDKMASNGTVVLTADGLVSVGVTDAATGTADVLNVVLSSASNLAAGNLTVANVETVNISTVDTEVVVAPAVQTKNVDSLTLTADKATTVNVSGGQDLTLTLTGSTKVATIDGSAMTGALTVTSLNTTSATTIKGGSANDVLTAATGTTADVLIGGAGDDTLTANAGLTTLTGGAGNDMFVIGTASLNSSSYATITDFAAGDLIKFTGADSFKAAKVTLGDTAVFQDFANAAMNAVGANDLAWFQFNGNTYIVMDEGTTNSTTFINGEDFIVKLTGLVDLTNASFNTTYSTIAI